MVYNAEDHGKGVWTITTDQPGPAIARFLTELRGIEIRAMYGREAKRPGLLYGNESDLHDITLITTWPHQEKN